MDGGVKMKKIFLLIITFFILSCENQNNFIKKNKSPLDANLIWCYREGFIDKGFCYTDTDQAVYVWEADVQAEKIFKPKNKEQLNDR